MPMQIPEYMCKGSHGPVVTELHIFLIAQGHGADRVIRGDRGYGDVTEDCLKEWQQAFGLKPTGQLGPEDKNVMKEIVGFDFDEFAAAVGGTTTFVQPNGTKLEWPASPN